MRELKCTKCGKPTEVFWHRYGKVWASCKYETGFEGECMFDLMVNPHENYKFDNGLTDYEVKGGIKDD